VCLQCATVFALQCVVGGIDIVLALCSVVAVCLQCAAVFVLQCGAVCCSVLQCVAVCLQCGAVCCSVLQCVAV